MHNTARSEEYDAYFFTIVSEADRYPDKVLVYTKEGKWAVWDLDATCVYEKDGKLYAAKEDGLIYELTYDINYDSEIIYDTEEQFGVLANGGLPDELLP
jgi:hypothetical protein